MLRSVGDPKQRLLLSSKKFYQYLGFLLRQFNEIDPCSLNAAGTTWSLGRDVEGLEKVLLFVHVNYDRDTTVPEEEPWPRGVEAKLNNTVFRVRHTAPFEEDGVYYAAFERFEMTFELGKHFKDKKELHNALESAWRKR